MLLSGLWFGSDFDLNEARRVIDRAFLTELAQDFEGAQDAVHDVLTEHGSAASLSSKALLEKYLDDLRLRREALTGSAPDWARAFRTLRDRPPHWSDLFWARLPFDPPEAALRLELRKATGLSREAMVQHSRKRFEKSGMMTQIEPYRFDVRMELAATDTTEVRQRSQVEAEGAYTLYDRWAEPRIVGSRSDRVTSTRKRAEEATHWAARRVLDRLTEWVVFDARLRVLERPVSRPPSRSTPP